MIGAALQQHVGEPSGRGPDVQAAAPGDRDAERVERVGQLHAPAGDVRGALVEHDGHVGIDELAGLVGSAPVRAEAHLAGQDRRGRARARGEQAPVGQQRVEPHLRPHGREPYWPQPLCLTSQSIGESTSILSGAMTAFRLISLSAHGAFELVIGLALMAAPFVLGLGAAGMLIALVAGALTVGLALGAAVADIGPIDVAAHYAYDVGLAIGLVGAAVVLAIASDAAGAAVFLAAALAQLALTLTTRYSAAS